MGQDIRLLQRKYRTIPSKWRRTGARRVNGNVYVVSGEVNCKPNCTYIIIERMTLVIHVTCAAANTSVDILKLEIVI